MRWTSATLLLLLTACATNEPAPTPKPAGSSQPSPAADVAAGHALLDEYTAALRSLADTGSADAMTTLLGDHEARLAGLEARLPAGFGDRYRRLLTATRRVITPAPDEAARAQNNAQIAAYAAELQGPDAPPFDTGGGLAAIGPLLAEEVLSLHMLLDGATDREQARAKYVGAR